jgi:CheY-like chemotaxis protein
MRKNPRLAKVNVLVADKDDRTALLVKQVLASLGFEKITHLQTADDALGMMKEQRFDLMLTERNLADRDGLDLVRSIRMQGDAKQLKRDIPIIMLTARAEYDEVIAARDAGISEFVAKPFSVRSLSAPLVQTIDKPRPFMHVGDYAGPCRRRARLRKGDSTERRQRSHAPTMRADHSLTQMLGFSASSIFTESLLTQAQEELKQTTENFHAWVDDDVTSLSEAFLEYSQTRSPIAYRQLVEMAYSIKSLAAMFGYDLGTDVAGMLVNYLVLHPTLEANHMVVVKKHIDTIVMVFNHQVKASGRAVAQELINSLAILTQKLG